ncbi:hypothetical protein EGI31_10835 [Lacihabitans soyangensis]|uniref:Uncharacterized protein n=1 Tax=Lacihabitans soyangensis TaxID=869394 RepID=A0AAE3H3L8_9BACT|nr:hypothetical protein [Lacihabitans soyangensis]
MIVYFLNISFNVSKGVSFCLMIQNYTTQTALKNRCDEVEDCWDESGIWCENKKTTSWPF